MHRWSIPIVLGLTLLAGATLTTAQTAPDGAFSKLSPGNQKIASALSEAQTGATRLTPDQIAALKQKGKGWGEVFKQMKSQGLVQQKNLGEVVSNYEHRHPEVAEKARHDEAREHAEKEMKNPDRDASISAVGPRGGGLGHVGGRGR